MNDLDELLNSYKESDNQPIKSTIKNSYLEHDIFQKHNFIKKLKNPIGVGATIGYYNDETVSIETVTSSHHSIVAATPIENKNFSIKMLASVRRFSSFSQVRIVVLNLDDISFC